MDYSTLKAVHVSCVVASGLGFILRAGFALHRPQQLRSTRVARIAPHLIDSILLASGLGLAWTLGLGVFAQAWLQTKLALLLLYIGCGLVALSHRRSYPQRVGTLACAIAIFTFMVLTAISKRPLGMF